jgi:hypothetical protein
MGKRKFLAFLGHELNLSLIHLQPVPISTMFFWLSNEKGIFPDLASEKKEGLGTKQTV